MSRAIFHIVQRAFMNLITYQDVSNTHMEAGRLTHKLRCSNSVCGAVFLLCTRSIVFKLKTDILNDALHGGDHGRGLKMVTSSLL